MELFSVYYNIDHNDSFESHFVGTFTSEAFAVEGFQQWIKGFLSSSADKEPMLIDLIESVDKCSSIKKLMNIEKVSLKKVKSISKNGNLNLMMMRKSYDRLFANIYR